MTEPQSRAPAAHEPSTPEPEMHESAPSETAAAAARADERSDAVTGLIAGCFATAVMSAFRIPISRSPPPTSYFWAAFLGDGDPDEYVGRGLLLHLLYGTVGGGVFGAVVGPALAGDDAKRERNATVVGAVYGLLLSAFGLRVLLDRLLRLDLDADERFVFHVSHLIYGVALGTWFGAYDE